MSNFVADAIEIITDDGTGIPVTYANTAIGLPSGGHFYLITDRPGLTGSKTITGDTTQTVWYEDILSQDFNAFLSSRSCDFVEFGGIETVSGMSFSIVNTAAFWKTLQDHGIYLGNCIVKHYRVTSADDATYNFELRWSGLIDDQPFDELAYSVQCVDNSKAIFQNVIGEAVDAVRFPNAPQGSAEKIIPLSLGRVAKAPTVNVSGAGTKATLANLTGNGTYAVGSVPFTAAACLAYAAQPGSAPADGNTTRPDLLINTPGVTFVASDTRLVGKYLSVIAGGVAQSVLIVDNLATNAGNSTDLYLSENLDVSTPFKAWTSTTQTDQDVWYVQVVDYAATLAASTRPIFRFIKNRYGVRLLSTYDSTNKIYSDISDTTTLFSLSNINYSNYPGFFVASKSADAGGGLTFYLPIVPKDILVALRSANWNVSVDLPSVGTSAPRLFDQDSSTFYTMGTLGGSGNQLQFDIFLPSDDVLKTYNELYLLLDLSHKLAVGTQTIHMTVTGFARDIYGRTTTAILASYNVKNSSLGSTLVDLFRLPGSYYNTTRDDRAFYIDKGHFAIQNFIGDAKKASAYNIVRFQIDVTDLGGTTYTLNLREIGLVGKRSLTFSSETAYSSLIGETFGSAWGGSRSPAITSTNPVLTIAEFLEKIVRDYGVARNPWVTGRLYSIGDKVRSTADNGHIYVCTVAGTSGNSEPSFPTGAGATVADNGITWKEFQTIPIDTASMDAFRSARAAWFGGRSITEKKSISDLVADLAKFGFFILVTGANGKLKAKPWRENTTALATFDASNIIPGTLIELKPTPMRRVSNDFTVKYDENPGSNSFNKQIVITNIDRPSFPTNTETLITGTSLGTFSIFWFLGLDGNYYFEITTSVAHGLATGNIVSLLGNTDGYDFPPTAISVLNTTQFYLLAHMPTASTSSGGALYSNAVSTLKWQTFVSGITNYASAKAIWNQCHSSFVLTKRVQKLSNADGECRWFIDPLAKDPGGNYIWADTVTPAYDLTNIADEHPAVFYTRNLSEWTAWQKKQVALDVLDTAAMSALEIGDPVYVNDAKVTNAAPLIGWINEKTQLAKTKDLPYRFRFGITLNPEQLNSCNRIFDVPGSANRILDTVGTANRILDVPC